METSKAISVKGITKLIKNSLENNLLLQSVWIEGEVSNFRAPFSGHWYFTMKDSDAILRCVMFKSRIRSLQGMPVDGDKILIRGNIAVYEKDGQYQCYVERWLPTGAGELSLAYEKLKERFIKEGLFDEESKKELPFFPKRIGVITSETGAAIQDMVRVSTRRNPTISLTLFPVRVQGELAAGEIAEGIAAMDKLGFDAIVVGRGGGSLEELWAFNEEVVVRAIHQAKTPVISAVGHESDVTLSDFAADVRAATPSQAMELLVPEKAGIERYIQREKRRLTEQMNRRIHFLRAKLSPLQKDGYRSWEICLGNQRREVERHLERIRRRSLEYIKEKKSEWSHLYLALATLDPYRNLARGYSIAEKLDGNMVTSYQDVEINERLRIKLAIGRLLVEVKERTENDEEKD